MKYTIFQTRKRLLAILIAVAFLFLLLSGRLLFIQVISSAKLERRAVSQWTRDLPITATRGLIVDRNGVVLAGNRTVYAVYVRPKGVSEPERVAKYLASCLGLNESKLLTRISDRSVSEITVARQVENRLADEILEQNFAGVYLTKDNERVYPYGDFLSQVLGYVSIDNVGQAGIEQYFNTYLKGIDGSILTQADLQGVEIEGSSQLVRSGVDGFTLELTIDRVIQDIVENILSQAMLTNLPKGARALVMSPQTGEILAMSNKPSVDLNALPRDDIAALHLGTRNSLVIDVYEPGSTFKIFTASADLEEYQNGNSHAFSNTHIFNGSRTRVIDGQTIKCWDMHLNGRHSNQNLQMALNNSCNPIFVDIAMALGKQTFYDYLEKFGFGKPTGLDFPGEQGGLLIPESVVKNCDLARIGFGQTIAVTPLQLLTGACAVINGGNYLAPYLAREIRSSDGRLVSRIYPAQKSKVLSEKTSALMRQMLEGVVEKGSGKHAFIEGYHVGGKTGTAQKYENGHIAEGKYVSSFVGFFPANNPQYAALVIIDEPVGAHYGSTVAAPYCQQIFEQIIAYKKIPKTN